jgi:hypothetical protein
VDNHWFQKSLYKNSGMQLDNIFEDLEAQFGFALETSAAKTPFERSNLVRIRRSDGRSAELVHPLLGDDFIAGMVLGSNLFWLYRLATLSQIEFMTLRGVDLVAIRSASLCIRDFLLNLNFPCEVRWVTHASVEARRGLIIDLVGELALLDTIGADMPIGVPLSSLAELQIISVDNFSADS